MENTEQIIIAKCEELKQQLLKELVKPKFEVNKWYKDLISKSLYFVVEFNGINKIGKNYGFNFNGDWMELEERTFSKDTTKEVRLATESEILEALTEEAVKRGLTYDNFNCLVGGNVERQNNIFYNAKGNKLCFGTEYNANVCFDNGKWAEIVKQKTLNEWADEFEKYYSLNFNPETASEAFKSFAIKHKFQLPK